MIEETPEEAQARRKRNHEKLSKRLAHLPVVQTYGRIILRYKCFTEAVIECLIADYARIVMQAIVLGKCTTIACPLVLQQWLTLFQ